MTNNQTLIRLMKTPYLLEQYCSLYVEQCRQFEQNNRIREQLLTYLDRMDCEEAQELQTQLTAGLARHNNLLDRIVEVGDQIEFKEGVPDRFIYCTQSGDCIIFDTLADCFTREVVPTFANDTAANLLKDVASPMEVENAQRQLNEPV